MKKFLAVLTVMLLLVMASCKKDWNNWECECKNPYPITDSENVPDISWTEYNSVQDACFHFERIVSTEDAAHGGLPSYLFSHEGDTLKVKGWLWNSEISMADKPGKWIANDKRYASGTERYEPWRDGEGIELTNLHITDSLLIKNKCFLTGIIGFTTCVWEGDSEDPCDRLRLKLRVVDVFFEEDGK